MLEIGDDAEALQAWREQAKFDTHDDWTALVFCR